MDKIKVFATAGNDQLARVYMAHLSGERYVEFVESKIPGAPREKKWVLIVSTLAGCPVGCPMCDAGALPYRGTLTKEEIMGQIDFLIKKYYPDGVVPVKKFKIQFSRVGEPSFNPAVLEVLDDLPQRYTARDLVPALSTIAPRGKENFFEKLITIKERHYRGRFQLQFSIHSTSEETRFRLIPCPHWSMDEISRYGRDFVKEGDKKITLNFAVMEKAPIEADVIAQYFDPRYFLVKFTPLNPTDRSWKGGLVNSLEVMTPETFAPARLLQERGYDVILSVGELEENLIGSNCGQFIRTHLESSCPVPQAYSYVPL